MGVDCKGLLFSSVGDGAKRIEEPTHEVITSVDSLVSNISAKQYTYVNLLCIRLNTAVNIFLL